MVDLGPDPVDDAREFGLVVPRDRESHLLAGLHLGDVGLVDVDPEPDLRRVGDGEDPARRLDRLPLDRVPDDDDAGERGDHVQV